MPAAPDSSSPVAASLQRRIARLDACAATLAARSRRISRARLALALVGGVAAIGVGTVRGDGTGWLVALAVLVVFVALARRHERVERARTRLARWRQIQTQHLARLTLDWDALGPPAAPAAPDHPFAADLDLAGPRSVLHLLDTTATEAGHERLRAWLLATAPDADTVRHRQADVRALVPHRHLRDRLALAGREAGQPTVATVLADAPRWSDRPLRAWLAAPASDAALGRWALGLSALAALAWTLLAVSLLGGPGGWTLAWFVYVALYLARYRAIADDLERAYALQQVVREAEPALTRLERAAACRADLLPAVWAPFRGADRPSALYARLGWIAEAVEATRNDVARIALNALLPYDLLLAVALGRLRGRLGAQMPAWLDAYAETEALAALASFADLHGVGVAFPTLAAPGDVLLDADALGHPLLPAGAVRNGVTLARGEVVVLTGSNMAGKSTFLRSTGVAAAMAWAGAPVVAERLAISPVRPFTSMRVGDALQEGVSTFYAEVRRLRLLLDAVEAGADGDVPPALVLLDEVYRGTNNRERLAGARALVRTLAGASAASLVATHDLALTRLADEIGPVRNAHFRERVEGGALVFDYTLRDGPCPTTNALAIMESAGLPVEAPDDAA